MRIWMSSVRRNGRYTEHPQVQVQVRWALVIRSWNVVSRACRRSASECGRLCTTTRHYARAPVSCVTSTTACISPGPFLCRTRRWLSTTRVAASIRICTFDSTRRTRTPTTSSRFYGRCWLRETADPASTAVLSSRDAPFPAEMASHLSIPCGDWRKAALKRAICSWNSSRRNLNGNFYFLHVLWTTTSSVTPLASCITSDTST